MLKPLGEKARLAAHKLALAGKERDEVLRLIAQMLPSQQQALLHANQLDMEAGANLNQALRDRLLLTEKRIADIAQAVEEIRALPDPVGELLWEDTRPNGLHIRRVAVPLGVIAVIYEARPNVTLDAAAMCLKSGNAVILRGGKEAIRTNTALTELVRSACRQAGLPEDCVQLVTDTTRQSATALMKLHGYVDLLIPRGGKALIQSTLQNATVPVLQTGEGVCHVYVDKAADIDMARKVTLNAKVNRPSTCNAAECLLVHRDIAAQALPLIAGDLLQAGVELRGDEAALALV
ncbi:MAG: glutamate-5-semialdehyde dehydrogenase, partial [Clostridiales bacterium]|nr:glutamate-5-semialdehyde dehydrogenase [Clostridiales bacterium]